MLLIDLYLSLHQCTRNKIDYAYTWAYTKPKFQVLYQAIFLKIDFSKAFDTIEWDFLFQTMSVRGFPGRWMEWLKELFQSASSRVIINGKPSDFFKHKRGLRQGDLLSPLLFNLAADVFQQMIARINRTLNHKITRKINDSILALQYADDTAVIASANPSNLTAFKMAIRIFASISRLHVNYNKSTFIPLNIHPNDLPWARAIIGCVQTNFPVQYLGLPLTITKPTRNLFMPLIEKMENKLAGWKCKIISKEGRLQLVQSVLSSIPVYYMMSFRLPQWVINRIDSIRRRFLWGMKEGSTRYISLIN